MIPAEAVEERDELADLLADSIYRYTGVSTSSSKEIAAELVTAGYRKVERLIPVEAVEAAEEAYRREFPYDENEGYVVKLILEAAAPHMQADRKSLADVLASHQQKVGIRDMRSHCWCGWSGEMTGRAFLEHQADAISAGGTK